MLSEARKITQMKIVMQWTEIRTKGCMLHLQALILKILIIKYIGQTKQVWA